MIPLIVYNYHFEWNSAAHPQHVEEQSGNDDGEGHKGGGPAEGHAPVVWQPDGEVCKRLRQVILRHHVQCPA